MIWLDPRLWLGGLVLAGAVGGSAYLATHLERSRWQAKELDRQQQARDEEEARARRAGEAGAEFERWRRAQLRRQAEVAHALSEALRAPITCPTQVGDVRVPAAAVDELRRAGADDQAGPAAAASEPGH